MPSEPGESEVQWVDAPLREAFQAARELEWDLHADDILGRDRQSAKHLVRRRVSVGLVAALIILVFFVPFPRSSIFNRLSNRPSSGSNHHPSGGTGQLIPRGFEPLSFASVGLADWWVLGSVPCNGSRLCPAVVRTTDDGAKFERVGAPVSGVNVGTAQFQDLGIVFANASDGWIFGPGLYATHDGGATWVEQHPAGTVWDVKTAADTVYALICPKSIRACAGSARPDVELLRSAVTGGEWRPVSVPIPLYFGTSLSVQNRTVVVMNGLSAGAAAALVVSTDGGTSFRIEASSCFPGLSGHVYEAITDESLWEACPTGMMATAVRSTDLGRRWERTPVEFTNGLEIAPLSANSALAWPGPPNLGLALTNNGGRSFRTVFRGESTTGGPDRMILWAGFATASRAYLLESTNYYPAKTILNELWESNDGGVSWAPVHFTRQNPVTTNLKGSAYPVENPIQVVPGAVWLATNTNVYRLAKKHWSSTTTLAHGSFKIDAAYALDSEDAWVCLQSRSGEANSTEIARTTDGGSHWLTVTLPANKTVNNPSAWITFPNNRDGFLTIAAGLAAGAGPFASTDLYVSTDGGALWSMVSSASVGPIYFLTPRTGWGLRASGGPGLLGTSDGGKDWNVIKLPAPTRLPRGVTASQYSPALPVQIGHRSLVLPVVFSNGILVSVSFYISADSGGSWSSSKPITNGEFSVGEELPVSILNASSWFVATPSHLYSTTNSGHSWHRANVPTSGFGFGFTSTTTGYMITLTQSGPGPLLETTSGGFAWRVLTVPAS